MNKEDILSIVPLLPAQQFMLSASLKGKPSEYIQQLVFEVRDTNFEKISRGISSLVDTYECLRAHILHEGLKQAVWVSLKHSKPQINAYQCTESAIKQHILSIRNKGFDLQKEPGLRFDWFETPTKSFLLITNHHILFDGWGRQKLLTDFIQLLSSPNLFLPQRTIKAWYDGWKGLNHEMAQAAYRSYVLPFESVAQLTEISSGLEELSEYSTTISLALVRDFAQSLGLTQAEYINFTWSCFIAGWTNNPTVQFGVVKQNGLIEQVTHGFGLAIQTLPLQFQASLDSSPEELISSFKSRERSVASFPYVDITDSQFNGISFNFLIAFENYPLTKQLDAAASTFKLLESYDFTEFPLSLAITPEEERLYFQWHFNPSKHSHSQIETVAMAYMDYLTTFQQRFQKPIRNTYPFKTQNYPAIHVARFFEEIEQRLIASKRIESYHKLIEAFKVNNTSRIWIYGDKHEAMDLVMLAAWKTKTAVLMVNEKESDEFITSLYAQCPPDAIFTAYPDHRLSSYISLDTLDHSSISPSSQVKNAEVALAICTSGSTGTPKVVQLSLANLVSFLNAWKEKLPWRAQEHFGVIAHPAFDIGVAELIFPIWQGWTRTLITKEILANADEMIRTFNEITAFHMVPTLLAHWIDTIPSDQKPRIIMTGGDRVPPSIQSSLKRKFQAAILFQFYGPSECSVLTSGFENKGQFPMETLPLGTPFSNASIHIVTPELRPCSPFEEGEIVISGPAVGLGYANETSEAFFTVNNEPAYRTGDRGLMDTSGQLYFRGRTDQQIKINGQRIELTRIEQALIQWSKIERWCIVYKAPILSAFYLGNSEELPPKDGLFGLLPAYAIPQLFEGLKEFPINKNGKIDYGALGLHLDRLVANQPVKSLDIAYQALFEALFPTRKIDVTLGWFANGFNSIDAMKLSGKIKKTLDKNIPIQAILTCMHLAQIPSLTEADELEQSIPITAGMKVHEAAARMFFLSESDVQFAKTYWIHSGFILPYDARFEEFLSTWIKAQEVLALGVTSTKAAYYWTTGNISCARLQVDSSESFIAAIEAADHSPFEHLIYIYYTEVADKILVGFSIHHGLLDGLGTQQLFSSLFKAYTTNAIEPLTLVEPETEPVDKDFWKPYLEHVTLHKLPFERIQKNQESARLKIKLTDIQQEKLRGWKTELGCSTFEAGLIGWIRLWHHYFPESTFSTGIIVSTRRNWNEHELVAMSSNSLPFVVRTDKPTDILTDWKTLQQKAKQPFADIAALETNKQHQGTPFFNTSFVYNQWEEEQRVKPLHTNATESAFDVSLDFIEEGNELYFQWEFNPRKFGVEAMQQFHNTYFQACVAVEEYSFTKANSLTQQWQDIVEQFGDRPALIQGSVRLSYAELHREIQEIQALNAGYNAGIVPLLLERNPHHIAFLMALLLDGIPFIPIDAESPKERLQLIAAHCGNPIHDANDLHLVRGEQQAIEPSLCYAIATSGTTGVPKLVGVKRSGYEAALLAWTEQYEITSEDRILQAASFSFDVFLGDLGRALFNGACMVLLDAYQRKDPQYMLDVIKSEGITLFETTPLVVRWWMQEKSLEIPNLRLLIVGSDSWKISEMKALIGMMPSQTKVISSYGLSETTIDNSFFTWRTEYHSNTVVPIGESMHHTSLSICTEEGKPLPDGMEGLLCIDGPCVGLGYYQAEGWSHSKGPWITADRGVKDEFGQFHFLGRADKQVKIRGQRLELNEVERIFSSIDSSMHWVAFSFQSGYSNELGIAYQGKLTSDEKQQLIHQLASSYPSYYVPSAWIHVEAYEMNQNGKINVKPLVDQAEKEVQQVDSLQVNGNAFERIQQLFKQLFNQEIQAEDHFFSLGKSSFDVMYFVREWNKINPEQLQVFQVFAAPDFSSLAQAVMLSSTVHQVPEVPLSYIPANAAQEAIWFEIQEKDSSIYNLPHFIELPEESASFVALIEKTLKACTPLFMRFEISEEGVLKQLPISSENYTLETLTINRDDLATFKRRSYHEPINLAQGPSFSAKLIDLGDATILYFNPHHIVYDGGSDSALAELFQQIQQGGSTVAPLPKVINSLTAPSWKQYFELSTPPKVIPGRKTNDLSPNLLVTLSAADKVQIESLQSQWRTSPAVIYTTLLGNALAACEIPVSWLSLVLDTRDEPCIGMYMRAFPFPIDTSQEISEQISKANAALEFLYRHKHSIITYPAQCSPDRFHQVGLVIQHPMELAEGTVTEVTQESRARLPLSLYVDTLGNNIQLRWEFDEGYFTALEVSKIQAQFHKNLYELVTRNIQRSSYAIVEEGSAHQAAHPRTHEGLNALWEKYLGPNAGNDFFLSGGTSLKALMFLKDVEKTLNKRIAIHAFFKDPTYEHVVSDIQVDSNALFWEIQEGEQGYEWYFPPIFGLGLIFNTYPITRGYKALAFNYPRALGYQTGGKQIEELAAYLIGNYLKTMEIPQTIDRIIAYSMGGLVAYEVVKILEQRGIQVKELVVWDKPAQLQYAPNYNHTLHPALHEYASKLAQDAQHQLEITRYLTHHQEMIEECVQVGQIKSNITLFYCLDGFDEEAMGDWSKLTLGTCTISPLPKGISHYDIPMHWKKP
jgi:fengycin family lipopeptide synthetase D